MGTIMTIANRKGGDGKTVTAHALGTGLSRKGFRVLLVDLESQGNLTFVLGCKKDPESDALALMLRERAASDCIQKTRSGADLIPASDRLSAADLMTTGDRREYQLRDALDQLRGDYDWILIDTPPSLGSLTVNALTASDQILITAQAEIQSFHGCLMVLGSVRSVQARSNPDLKISGILLTRYNSRTVISRDMRWNFENLAAKEGTKVFQTVIRECTAVKEAYAVQSDLWSYSPRCNAARDYESLIGELL